jgi:hypothetical protein
LKQFISGITELSPDAVQVLRAADQLEKDLVQIAVEDSVDSDDGGKAIIREMPPYEAEGAIANLVKIWIKTRIDRLKDWVDRNLQQEVCIHHIFLCFPFMILIVTLLLESRLVIYIIIEFNSGFQQTITKHTHC